MGSNVGEVQGEYHMKDAQLALLWHTLETLLVVAAIGLVWSIKKRNAPNVIIISRVVANRTYSA